MTGRLLDIRGAADYLGCYSERQLRDLVFKRQIPYMKVGRSIRFDVRQLDRWIERSTIPAEAS